MSIARDGAGLILFFLQQLYVLNQINYNTYNSLTTLKHNKCLKHKYITTKLSISLVVSSFVSNLGI